MPKVKIFRVRPVKDYEFKNPKSTEGFNGYVPVKTRSLHKETLEKVFREKNGKVFYHFPIYELKGNEYNQFIVGFAWLPCEIVQTTLIKSANKKVEITDVISYKTFLKNKSKMEDFATGTFSSELILRL